MSSILPGYEYDIFISYRQNDNKRDKWVTKFVEALQDELDVTLKNPVSIYFDENPHDGLLESDQVKATLNKKLKALVFIPILSQTYCDSKSYAWKHEFLPFIEMAKYDGLGIDITLRNGNIASRILPVQIHEIDPDDQQLFEQTTGNSLRSIPFIFKSKGVNRPLRPEIDDPKENQNHTVYRDQINKVANALKAIGVSIYRNHQSRTDTTISPTKDLDTPMPKEVNQNKNQGNFLIGIVSVLLLLIMMFFYKDSFTSISHSIENKSIAVLYFDNMSGDPEQEYFSDGITEEIIARLANVEGLKVISRTSVRTYKGKPLNLKQIAKDLNVSTVLEGSFRKDGNRIKVTAQLIDAKTDEHLWAETYERELKDIFQVQSDIAHEIAEKFEIEVSTEADIKINKNITSNTEAYDYYLRARYIGYHDYGYDCDSIEFERAKLMYQKAIEYDSNLAEAYAGLADLYDARRNCDIATFTEAMDSTRHSLSLKSYQLNPNSAFVHNVRIWMLVNRPEPLEDSAFYHAKRALELDPNDYYNYECMGQVLQRHALSDVALPYFEKALELNPMSPQVHAELANCYWEIGQNDKANQLFSKAFELEQHKRYTSMWYTIINLIHQKRIDDAQTLIDNLDLNWDFLDVYVHIQKGDSAKATAIADSSTWWYMKAQSYAVIGDKIKALKALEEGLENYNRSGIFRSYLWYKNTDFWKNFEDDPKYQELLEIMRNKYDADKMKYGIELNEFNLN